MLYNKSKYIVIPIITGMLCYSFPKAIIPLSSWIYYDCCYQRINNDTNKYII